MFQWQIVMTTCHHTVQILLMLAAMRNLWKLKRPTFICPTIITFNLTISVVWWNHNTDKNSSNCLNHQLTFTKLLESKFATHSLQPKDVTVNFKDGVSATISGFDVKAGIKHLFNNLDLIKPGKLAPRLENWSIRLLWRNAPQKITGKGSEASL